MGVLSELFLSFFKIGLFTFGGGYAMISIIENDCVEKKKWITHDEMMDITVIAESTPGPIAINCATYVGYKKAGLKGAVFSTIGVVVPSFVIILIISLLLDAFLEYTVISSAFKGIKAAVGLLIIDAAVKMIKKMKKNIFSVCIIILSFLLMFSINIFSLNFSSASLMLSAAFISLTLFVFKERLKGGRENDLS